MTEILRGSNWTFDVEELASIVNGMTKERETVFERANHICVVTADLDQAVKTWSDRFGVGPWSTYTWDETRIVDPVGGGSAGFGIRVGLGQIGGEFGVELIEPLDERSIYAESLAEHGGRDHFHHISLEVADFEAKRGELVEEGVGVELDAILAGAEPGGPGCHATYFESDAEIGVRIEISEVPDGFALPEPDQVYPPVSAGS